METTNKVCHQCGEEIKKIAKKCPHCQSWQKGVNSFFVNQPAAGAIVAIIPMAFFFIWLTFSDGIFGGKGASFDQYRHLVAVEDSTSNYQKEGDKGFVTTVGRIKNNSDKTWKGVYIEVQYFNEAGALTDTQSNLDYGLILSPNSETTFPFGKKPPKITPSTKRTRSS
jgi:hypothetical protein